MLLCLAVVGQGGGQAGRWALSAAAGSQGGSRDWSIHCTTCIRSDDAGLICCAQLTRKGSGQRRIHRLCAVAALQAQPAASGTAGVVGCPGGQVDASGRTAAYASTSQSKLAGVEVVWLPVPPWQHLNKWQHAVVKRKALPEAVQRQARAGAGCTIWCSTRGSELQGQREKLLQTETQHMCDAEHLTRSL